MTIDDVRALFPALDVMTYLDTASYAVGSLPVRDAYYRALDAWLRATLRWQDADQAGNDGRRLFARFVNAEPEEIAIVPSVSTAAGVVAAQLPPASPGENVLVSDIEFSSNYYPWFLLRDRGYEVRLVRAVDGAVPAEAFEALADGGTRLIAVSAVQASSGYRAPLRDLADLARRSGAWLFVDGAQAVGAIDVDVRRDAIDFLVAPSHKFLLGNRGMGYLFVRQALVESLRPVLPGWRAARRPGESFFGPAIDLSETASRLDTALSWLPALAEPAGLRILDRFGLENAIARNRLLSTYLHGRLSEVGLLDRSFAEQARSHIVSVAVSRAESVVSKLRASGVVVSKRGDRVRLSVHFYNTESEIDRAVALLERFRDAA